MDAPTETLTRRAAEVLGEPVVLAVRVRKGPRSRPPSRRNPTTMPETPFPAGGLPIVPMLRSAKQALTDLFAGDEVERAVLVFTMSGERLLMGRHRFRPLQPTAVARRFEAGSISVDLPLLSEHLIPELTIDDDQFTVNSVDFGVLTRAAVAGELNEPFLAEQLTPYFEQARALAQYDPATFHSMISGERIGHSK